MKRSRLMLYRFLFLMAMVGVIVSAVTINVTDVNENRAPVFTDGASTTRSIIENTASGTNIGTAIAATDPDTGDTLTCSLGGTDASII